MKLKFYHLTKKGILAVATLLKLSRIYKKNLYAPELDGACIQIEFYDCLKISNSNKSGVFSKSPPDFLSILSGINSK